MKKRHLDPRGIRIRFALLLMGLAVLFIALLLGSQWLEKRAERPEQLGDYRQRYAYEALLEVDGVAYRPRKRLTTILLMGVDRDTAETTKVSYRNGGQADFLRLLVIDPERKQIAQLQIDRDTMTPITILGVLGNRSGVREAQIALSHGFGDGREQSCELTVEAVSNLLLGVDIDFYAAMNMDGIAALNDAAGGVTVILTEDFSTMDSAMTKGATLTLSGEQAEIFVRGRMNVGDGTNEGRMERQQAFMSALSEQLEKRQREDSRFAEMLYDALSPYLVTNLSKARLIKEAWYASDYEHVGPYSLEGTHEVGSTSFMQFIVDEASLQEIVLELFYEKVI